MNVTSEDVVKVDKASWPRTSDGTIDWESVFEDTENGLIPAISTAKTSEGLVNCAAAITEALFSRRSDEDIRAGYTRDLASISLKNTLDIDTLRDQIITYLRAIKSDRTKRAADWVSHKTQRLKEEPLSSQESALTDETEILFQEAFCEHLQRRFQVMWNDVPQVPFDNKKLPFLVSSAFAVRYMNLVRSQLIAEIVPRCRHIISHAQQLALEKRAAFFREKMKDPLAQKELNTVWDFTWDDMMTEDEIPQKPDIEEKGMLKSLVKAVTSMGEMDDDVYTLEDWKEDVKEVKIQRRAARANWARLTAPSDDFDPPVEADRALLKSIFSKSAGSLRDQSAALRQIAQQAENVGKAYDDYSKGKDLEIPLLIVSYQNPDLFLREGQVLKTVLRGLSKSRKKVALPLIVRYLNDYI